MAKILLYDGPSSLGGPMRRAATILLVAATAAAVAPAALAKFGISKTRVILPRLRPPESPLMAETVAVEVKADSSDVAGSQLSLVRSRVEDALRASGLYRLVDRPRDADAVLRVTLSDLRAEVRDEVRLETRRVKIGERQEWDDKKKKNVTKDVYGDRQEPVSWRIADGSLAAVVEVTSPDGTRTSDAGGSYHRQFKVDGGVPPEAATEESLKAFLVQASADRAIASATFAPDPVEALLAVNGELKAGNQLAEAGHFEQALEEWSRHTYKGDTEAARLHNVGVAHEALAYGMPPYTPEHRTELEQAKDLYLKAQALDPGEKYFREPSARIQTSLSYAASASLFASELQQFREERSERQATRPQSARPREAAAPQAEAPEPSAVASPLRNGSFEPALAPWILMGKGNVVSEAGRGRVLEVAPSPQVPVQLRQAIGVDVDANREAPLSLDYKVLSGEGRIRLIVAYADATGRERTSTLEVTGGEGPGDWSHWSADVAGARPRPSRVKEVRIAIEGGTVRLDNVALSVR